MSLTAPTRRNLPIDREIREIAFGLWATQAGRSPKRVSELLRQMGHDVKPDTISQWSIRGGGEEDPPWAERVDRELTVAVPGMRREAALSLIAQGVIAARIRQQMLADLERNGKAPDKTALALTDSALAFAGFSPVGHDRVSSASGSDQRRGALAHLTDEDVQRIASGQYR